MLCYDVVWHGCIFRSADISTGALMFDTPHPCSAIVPPPPENPLYSPLLTILIGVFGVIPVTSIKMGAYVAPEYPQRFPQPKKIREE